MKLKMIRIKNKKIIFFIILIIFVGIPFFIFAQNSGVGTEVQTAPSFGFGGENIGAGANIAPEGFYGGSGGMIGYEVTKGGNVNVIPATSTINFTQSNIGLTRFLCTLAPNPNIKDLILYAACMASSWVAPLIL